LVYKKITKNNNDIKIVAATAISFLILITLTFYVFKELFLNKDNGSRYNTLLYTQVLNSGMPIVKVTSFEDEVLAEENITIKGEVLKLMGINMYNPMSILGREISFLNDSEQNYVQEEQAAESEPLPEQSAKGGAFTIDDFKLSDEQISLKTPGRTSEIDTDNSNNTVPLNIPNKAVEVYNPNIKKSS
jgi:hypothetical protein